MSPVAEYEEVGHIFRPEVLSVEEVATINDELDRIVADGQCPGLHGSGSNLSQWRRRLISLTYNALSNKATPTTRSRDIVPDDSTVPALEALGNDCLLVGAAEV